MCAYEWIIRAASACDKQFYLDSLVNALDWHLDLDSGLLSFGAQYRWHAQLLGTEASAPRTWLWAWANIASNISDHLLTASRAMKAFGEQHNISELTQPEVPLTHLDGHSLSLLASGVCNAEAYYRCPYDGGALFVLIRDETFPKCVDPPLARIASVFPQVITSFDIPDHRLAFTGYLAHYGLLSEQLARQVIVKEAGEPVLVATFDEQNRLTALEVALGESEEQPVESWDQGQLRRMLRG